MSTPALCHTNGGSRPGMSWHGGGDNPQVQSHPLLAQWVCGISDHRAALTKVTLIFPRAQALCMTAKVKRWRSRSSRAGQEFCRRAGLQHRSSWSWTRASPVSLRVSLLLTLLKHLLPQAKWFMALGLLLLQDIYVSWQMVCCTTCCFAFFLTKVVRQRFSLRQLQVEISVLSVFL